MTVRRSTDLTSDREEEVIGKCLELCLVDVKEGEVGQSGDGVVDDRFM